MAAVHPSKHHRKPAVLLLPLKVRIDRVLNRSIDPVYLPRVDFSCFVLSFSCGHRSSFHLASKDSLFI
ncbi:hypothetical protein L1987_61424 [Smallanthus sonchifolius]|uniref:Uncharacterized protein n=1 Tax=Smallanthus sonchifolius TaxID=185202 RepID=A0ACB9C7M0_9ASTR|nr:hypothetical protein L1987_61424 [Smallanthus sonchifolius]